jgi:hypothetical protein
VKAKTSHSQRVDLFNMASKLKSDEPLNSDEKKAVQTIHTGGLIKIKYGNLNKSIQINNGVVFNKNGEGSKKSGDFVDIVTHQVEIIKSTTAPTINKKNTKPSEKKVPVKSGKNHKIRAEVAGIKSNSFDSPLVDFRKKTKPTEVGMNELAIIHPQSKEEKVSTQAMTFCSTIVLLKDRSDEGYYQEILMTHIGGTHISSLPSDCKSQLLKFISTMKEEGKEKNKMIFAFGTHTQDANEQVTCFSQLCEIDGKESRPFLDCVQLCADVQYLVTSKITVGADGMLSDCEEAKMFGQSDIKRLTDSAKTIVEDDEIIKRAMEED